MLDHVGLEVGDYERSKAFYEKALAPLGAVCHKPA
jgi:catechol 2,3-dioxygenase-like lactoylglutathione lyase family enzyme